MGSKVEGRGLGFRKKGREGGFRRAGEGGQHEAVRHTPAVLEVFAYGRIGQAGRRGGRVAAVGGDVGLSVVGARVGPGEVGARVVGLGVVGLSVVGLSVVHTKELHVGYSP